MLKYLTTFLISSTLIFAEEKKKDEEKKEESIKSVEKQDKVTIDGAEIPYRARASTLQLRDEKGKAKASIFHVTYERLGVKKRKDRPVVFCFNGGPGSSAVWLHLGGIGPRIVPSTEDGTKTLPPPRGVIPNPHSILDIADLVFIDPVSTGYSRTEEGTNKSDYHGVKEDVESVGDFIRRWTSENDRWASPKFLLGESYGGVRAAGLSNHLQNRYGMTLNGSILLSSLLDFRTLRGSQGDDLLHSVYLPAFTAVAHYHKKITGSRDELYQQASDYANNEYSTLLLRGATLSDAETEKAAKTLSKLTGISSQIWKETNLRLSPARFRKELLRDQGLVIGRFDARVAWPASNSSEDYPKYDPSYSVVYGAFSTAMNDYLSRELEWEGHHPYEILTGKVHPWNWGKKNKVVNLSGELTTAMRNNPDLRILVMGGYADLATPPSGIQHSLNHLWGLPDERREGIQFAWYEAGHMFYLNQPDLVKMRKDLVQFITPKD